MKTISRFVADWVATAGCTGPSSADSCNGLPLWLHHAADDAVVEVQYSRDRAEARERSKYSKYPEGGHGIAGKAFNDPAVHEGMFSQGVECPDRSKVP